MDFARNLSRALKYTRSTVDSLLREVNSHGDHLKPKSDLRLITADAMQEAGREREATLLRSEHPIFVVGTRDDGLQHSINYFHDPDGTHTHDLQVTRHHPEDLNQAIRGYKEAALWSTTHFTGPDNEEHPLDERFDTNDLHLDTHRKMNRDLTNYFEDNFDRIPPFQFENTGAHFWFARNGHGTGFFDHPEEYGESTDHLQDEARKYGEYNLQPEEDGKIHGY